MHTFSLGRSTPKNVTPFGTRSLVTQQQLPILSKMALYRLVLAPRGFREPHWHPNAHELGYCARGTCLVTLFLNGNEHESFLVCKGELFFIPSGALHHIENVGEEEAEFLLCFSHEQPEDFGLSGSVGAMSRSVMGNTWDLPIQALDHLISSPDDLLIGQTQERAPLSESLSYSNRFKLSVEKMSPQIANAYGTARTATSSSWPILEELSMFSLRIAGTGMREPHWHPRTAELGYILSGQARMTVRGPQDDVDTYTLEEGDCYFIPKGYPHDIENLLPSETHLLVFFDQALGQDIGYSGGIAAYPPRILIPTLMRSSTVLPPLPGYVQDAMLVEKKNSVDLP